MHSRGVCLCLLLVPTKEAGRFSPTSGRLQPLGQSLHRLPPSHLISRAVVQRIARAFGSGFCGGGVCLGVGGCRNRNRNGSRDMGNGVSIYLSSHAALIRSLSPFFVSHPSAALLTFILPTSAATRAINPFSSKKQAMSDNRPSRIPSKHCPSQEFRALKPRAHASVLVTPLVTMAGFT